MIYRFHIETGRPVHRRGKSKNPFSHHPTTGEKEQKKKKKRPSDKLMHKPHHLSALHPFIPLIYVIKLPAPQRRCNKHSPVPHPPYLSSIRLFFILHLSPITHHETTPASPPPSRKDHEQNIHLFLAPGPKRRSTPGRVAGNPDISEP